MERIPPRVWRMPDRLSPTRARLLIALSATTLALAVLGLFAFDGLERAIYAVMFFSIGFSNLAWAVGSLLPDERRSRAARTATLPLGIVMFLAIFAWVALAVSGRW